MIDYSVVESAVVSALIAHFPNHLSVSRCRAGDIDSIIDAMFSENEKYGCLVEFGAGSDTPRKSFTKDVWSWNILGVFLIRYSDTIETELREIVSELPTVFSGDRRLGGVSANTRVYSIERPEVGDVNDVPFYFIPFAIEAVTI